MRDDGTAKRTALRDLFAERQVHMRSGHQSRYVVLSPALQVGVAAGGVALAALLILASYGAISGRLAVVEQQRALAELTAQEAAAQEAATQLATLQERSAAAEREITRLNAALAQAQDDSEAMARIETLQSALDAVTADKEALATELGQARAASLAQATERSGEVDALRAEVTGLRAEIGRLEREAESLRRAAGQPLEQTVPPPTASPGAPAGAAEPGLRITIAAERAEEVQQLQRDLARAQAAIAALSADLEAAKNPQPGAGPARPATIAAADLASLMAQLGAASRRIEQLGTSPVPPADAAPESDAVAEPALPLPPPPAPR